MSQYGDLNASPDVSMILPTLKATQNAMLHAVFKPVTLIKEHPFLEAYVLGMKLQPVLVSFFGSICERLSVYKEFCSQGSFV